MGQIILELDAQTEAQLETLAKADNVSKADWLTKVIEEQAEARNIHPSWSPEVLALAGSWRDEDFPSQCEIRASIGKDSPRETW